IGGLVIDPQNPSTLYAGTSGESFDSCTIPCSGFNDGVFRSTDAGATWTAINSGLTMPHVASLAIDPQNPSTLYAGTIHGRIFAITFAPDAVISDLRFDRTSIAVGNSFSATFAGSNLTTGTFLDVRFTAPDSSLSGVALNWQRGTTASHNVAPGTVSGTWTI